MSTAAQRNEKINKLFKIARKHFQPITPPTHRSVIEHMLYSCCLENAPYDLADEVFARLQEEYFDWNEVRVTTTAELAEVMKRLPEPEEAANRVRRSLHGLFEAHYTFDLEFLRKENLGKATEQLSKYRGMSPFCVSYTSQVALGGHSIPIDDAFIELAKALDIVSEEDAAQKKVTGLERTIPKNKGTEFTSLVHQLAVSYHSSPFNKDVRAIIMEIDSEAQDRFPRRGGKKKTEAETEAATPAEVTTKSNKAEKPAKGGKPEKAAKPAAEKTTRVKKAEKAAPTKKAPAKKAAAAKPAKKAAPKAPAANKKAVKKAPAKKAIRRKPR